MSKRKWSAINVFKHKINTLTCGFKYHFVYLLGVSAKKYISYNSVRREYQLLFKDTKSYLSQRSYKFQLGIIVENYNTLSLSFLRRKVHKDKVNVTYACRNYISRSLVALQKGLVLVQLVLEHFFSRFQHNRKDTQ